MRKLLLTIGVVLLITSVSFSQNHFKYTKVENGNQKTVFTVLGLEDSNQVEELKNAILQLQIVKEVQVFYDRRFKITSDSKLDFYAIREIIKFYNADIQYGYCVVEDKRTHSEIKVFESNHPIEGYTPQIISAKTWVFPDDFPSLNNISEKTNLKEAKQNWIENNPNKWRTITGLEYLDFSINLDFNTK